MKIKNLIRLMREQIAEFNRNTKRFNNERYVHAWIDEFFCFFLYGATPDDYYKYAFHKKNARERNSFITYRRSKRLIKENGKNAEAIVEKDLFNKRFAEFLNRDWIDLQTASTEELADFLDKHDGQAFMKPLGGACGKGIFILTKEDFEKNSRDISVYRNFIAEEVIVQNTVISKLNPSSVNTIRVLTYKGEILLCALKLGTGTAIVDNQHSDGINGNVDLQTGITNTPFFDLDLNEYYRHPTTNEILLGVQVPNWEILKEKVTVAANRISEVPYLGWDVAILDNDIAIIEANEAPDHDLVQRAPQIGVYGRVKEINRRAR